MAEETKEQGAPEDEPIQVPHKIVLEFPFQYGKEREVKEITFTRRLKAKDFRGVSVNNILFDDMLRLISKSTGESQALVDELDTADMQACVKVVNSFLSDGRKIGENG